MHRREKSRDHGSARANGDVNQTGNSRPRSSADVDVVYIDPFTGNTISGGGDGREDATSAGRDNCFRHRRSLFTDSEITSLPVGPDTGVGADGVVGLPVVSVTFHQVCFTDRLTDQLTDVLLGHRSFRILTFVKCRSVDACLCRMRQNLVERKCGAGSKLSRLNVRLSLLDDVDAVAELAEVLFHSLHALSLTGCSIMSAGCSAVVRSLVAGSRRLSELDLGFNDVTDVSPLSDALAANCSLRNLRLRGNAIASAAAASLFDSLRRNYRLELLDISGNPIGDRQKSGSDDLWRTVAEALLSNRSLRELKLERCSLGVEACSALGRALAANTTLGVLDVSMNQSIGDLGVTLVADGLRHNRRSGIRTLALNMCAVGNVGFRSLLVAIKDGGAAGLQHVKLCYNHIGSRRRRRRGVGVTNGAQESPQRPRPASTHFELRFQEELHVPEESDQTGGGFAVPAWLIGSNGEGERAVPSSMPVRRKNRSGTCGRPLSSVVTTHNLLVRTANQDNQPMSSQNLTASDRDARLLSNGATGTVFERANHRPALESTPTTSRQLQRTLVDGNWTAVKELPTLSESPDTGDSVDSRLELDSDASSVLLATTELGSSVDCAGTTTAWPDRCQLLTRAAVEDRDVDDDEASIYVLLCRVLRANPQLKVLLWGN